MKFTRLGMLILIFFLPVQAIYAQDTGLAGNCGDCHGTEGVSSESDVPTIAGQLSDYITSTLKSYQNWGRPCIKSDYRSGDVTRPAITMCAVAEGLSRDDINALGEHYAVLPFVAANQEFDPAKAETGGDLHEIHCESCHAMGGSIAGRGPRLAGQWMPYLRTAIKQAMSGEHLVPPVMEIRLYDFSQDDIEALVNFYASQQL